MAAAVAGTPLLTAATRPGLLVWLVTEQFRPDYLDEMWPSFGPGGFRRLVEGGSYFPNCHYDSATFTSSGLATLLTGTWPALHGVAADRWFDASTGQPADASAGALRSGTLFDTAVAAERNRVFLAASGSGASFLQGCRATRSFVSEQSVWKSAAGGNPDWLAAFRETNDPAKWRGAQWIAANAPPGAKPLRTMEESDFPALYRASPFALANEFALAREIVIHERAGAGPGLDIVAMLIGSPGMLGLETGANSPLMRDMVLDCDRQVGALLDLLDDHVGRGNYAIAFTAAHGLDAKTPERRGIDGAGMARAIGERLAAAYDTGPTRRNYVEAYLYPFVYLNRKSLVDAKANLREARALAGRAALETGNAAGYFTADGDCSYTGGFRERLANSFVAGRSGDVMLSWPAHAAESAETIAAGSIYNYDTRVPLLLYGPAFRAETFETAVGAIDVAPTLCRALGLGLPPSSTGRVLGEAIAAPKAGR